MHRQKEFKNDNTSSNIQYFKKYPIQKTNNIKMVARISLVVIWLWLRVATAFAPHQSLTGTSSSPSASHLCMADDNPFNKVKSSFLETFGRGEPKFEPRSTRPIEDPPLSLFDDDDDDKFGMAQRLESIKCVAIGAISGGIAVAPVAYFHYMGNLAQWEFTTDMASLQAALFAIVYRYAVREDDNPMLNSGVVGAFVLVRTLSNIVVSKTCLAIPLQCEFVNYIIENKRGSQCLGLILSCCCLLLVACC
jgi:hypothetical protein